MISRRSLAFSCRFNYEGPTISDFIAIVILEDVLCKLSKLKYRENIVFPIIMNKIIIK